MSSGWPIVECIVFAVFIFALTCAPLWKRKTDKGIERNAKRDYIFAGGGVSTLAMILSVSRGTLGVRSILGFPSELVYKGSALWETLYGYAIAFPVVCLVFVPVYYRLQTNSVYEYLRMRFNSQGVRRMAALTFIIRQVLNLAVTVYTPTVALHAVLNLPHWASAAALTAVAILFNMLGGLAAAIRADVIQTIIMILVSGAFIVQATIKAGGPAQVLADNIDGDRLQFFKFTWDPTVRVDTLSAVIGQLFMAISIYGCQQTFVQRYCSMSSEAKVRRTLLVNVPAVSVLFSLSWVVGMAVYAVYKNCDPLTVGQIAEPDEILPFYVQNQLYFVPGMLGLFLASLFNGALSFLVSNLNSLATVTWEDFVSAAPVFKGINDKQQLTIIKIIVVFYSFAIMGLSLCVSLMGDVVEGAQFVTSATSGPLLGVFTLAALFPVANGKGALVGMIVSHVLTVWMAIGRLLYIDKDASMLPLSTQDCPLNLTKPMAITVNHTLMQIAPFLQQFNSTSSVPAPSYAASLLHSFYAVSYMWYAVIGTISCIVIGIVVGFFTSSESDAFDERLLHPFAAKIARMLPGPQRTFTIEKQQKVSADKESSEKTEDTVVEEVKSYSKDETVRPKSVNSEPVFISTSSRLFDAYEKRDTPSPTPRTRF